MTVVLALLIWTAVTGLALVVLAALFHGANPRHHDQLPPR